MTLSPRPLNGMKVRGPELIPTIIRQYALRPNITFDQEEERSARMNVIVAIDRRRSRLRRTMITH
jgi:hypothetical protein